MKDIASAPPKWDRDPDAWYQEPSWPSERLFEEERFEGCIIDPCAGSGTIPNAARAAGLDARAFDLRDRGFRDVQGGLDFFNPNDWWPGIWPCDNIVSNPPYATWDQIGQRRPPGAMPRTEDEFLRLALARARCKVALFLSSSWINGAQRGAWLETLPLYRVYMIGPRPSCPPGRYLLEGNKPVNGKEDYSWFIFLKGYSGAPTLHWLRRAKT